MFPALGAGCMFPALGTGCMFPVLGTGGTFSRAWRLMHVLASSFDWVIALFLFFVVGQSDYFGFGFTTAFHRKSI